MLCRKDGIPKTGTFMKYQMTKYPLLAIRLVSCDSLIPHSDIW
jgi:hypothetical protein